MIHRGVVEKRGSMQGNLAGQWSEWYGHRRFVIAVIAISTILLVTLAAAIYSYVSAFTTVTHLSSIDIQTSLVKPTVKESQITISPSNPVTSTGSAGNESGANVNASISTNSNSTTPSVTVNGTPITVPDNGVTQQNITTDQGNVNVQVQSSSTTSDSTTSHSNLRVNLHSSSTTTDGN